MRTAYQKQVDRYYRHINDTELAVKSKNAALASNAANTVSQSDLPAGSFSKVNISTGSKVLDVYSFFLRCFQCAHPMKRS